MTQQQGPYGGKRRVAMTGELPLNPTFLPSHVSNGIACDTGTQATNFIGLVGGAAALPP
jgi:hypothetical protein